MLDFLITEIYRIRFFNHWFSWSQDELVARAFPLAFPLALAFVFCSPLGSGASLVRPRLIVILPRLSLLIVNNVYLEVHAVVVLTVVDPVKHWVDPSLPALDHC